MKYFYLFDWYHNVQLIFFETFHLLESFFILKTIYTYIDVLAYGHTTFVPDVEIIVIPILFYFIFFFLPIIVIFKILFHIHTI